MPSSQRHTRFHNILGFESRSHSVHSYRIVVVAVVVVAVCLWECAFASGCLSTLLRVHFFSLPFCAVIFVIVGAQCESKRRINAWCAFLRWLLQWNVSANICVYSYVWSIPFDTILFTKIQQQWRKKTNRTHIRILFAYVVSPRKMHKWQTAPLVVSRQSFGCRFCAPYRQFQIYYRYRQRWRNGTCSQIYTEIFSQFWTQMTPNACVLFPYHFIAP